MPVLDIASTSVTMAKHGFFSAVAWGCIAYVAAFLEGLEDKIEDDEKTITYNAANPTFERVRESIRLKGRIARRKRILERFSKF